MDVGRLQHLLDISRLFITKGCSSLASACIFSSYLTNHTFYRSSSQLGSAHFFRMHILLAFVGHWFA